MHYLSRTFDLDRPELVNAWDETSLWAAPFGLLMLREMPLPRSGAVLDIGCGTGFPLLPLSQRLGPDVRVCGLDPWEAAIERARAKAAGYQVDHVELHVGSADAMPFGDAEFSVAVSNLGINNFDNPAASFAEARRVLTDDGQLCITTNPVGTFDAFYDVFRDALTTTENEAALDALEAHVRHRHTRDDVEAMFTAAGFSVQRVVEDTHALRYASGHAFLNDYLIVLGFLPSWKALVPAAAQRRVFEAIERGLDANDDVRIEVPMLYVQGSAAPR